MPATRLQRARVGVSAMLPWRLLFPNRTVRRKVHGVDLYMPWSHVLPDYARGRSLYGRNLLELAGALRTGGEEFRMVDIGANIGDTAMLVLDRVSGKALCVEGDDYWARYLRMNTGEDPRVTIEEVMLAPSEMESTGLSVHRHQSGSSVFVKDGETEDTTAWVSAEELRERNPEFADVRLIKSDIDGYDPILVPELARAWSDSRPVLFFEYCPEATHEVAGYDPTRIWDDLADLGYSRFAVWDNTGDPLGQLEVTEAKAASADVDPPRPDELGYSFWDVAACRPDDSEALAAFDQLVGSDFDRHGKSRRAAA